MKKLFSLCCFGLLSVLCTLVLLSCGAKTMKKDASAMPVLKAHFIGAPPADLSLVQSKINEYTKEKLGLTVDIVFTDFGDFDQKTQMIINSGELYDIVFTCAWANDYLTNAHKGSFLNLSPYLATKEFKALNDVVDSGFWNGAKVDGNIYAIPTQKEIAIMPMYMFNAEFVKESGFDIASVKTLADTETYLQYVKKSHPEAIPFKLYSDRAWRGSFDYILGFDYPIAVDTDGKVKYMYDIPDVMNYAKTVRNFFKKGYINNDAVTTTGTNKLGDVFGLSFADGQPYAETTWSNECGFAIVTAEASKPLVTTSTTRGAMLAINKNSKNPEAALSFLQAVNTDSYLHNLLNYGVEDVHYKKIGANAIERTEQGIGKYLVPTFALGNLFNTYTLKGEPEDKWAVFKKENDSAQRSPLLGLDIDTTNIKNQLAVISNLRIQYEPLIQTGSVDVETKSAEFKKKLEEVGLSTVLAEIQSQIDAFLAKK